MQNIYTRKEVMLLLHFAGLLRSAKKSDIVRLKIQHCELIQNKIHEQRQKVCSWCAYSATVLLCCWHVECIIHKLMLPLSC